MARRSEAIAERVTNLALGPLTAQPVPTLYFPVPSRARYGMVDSYGRVYVPGTSRKYSRGSHRATDIGYGGTYPDLAACVAGQVVRVNWGSAFGTHLVIRTPAGGGFLYAHLLKSWVPIGATVKFGQQKVFRGDSTGQVTAGHLHGEWHPVWYDFWSTQNAYRALEVARQRYLKAHGLKAVARRLTPVLAIDAFEPGDHSGPSFRQFDQTIEWNREWFDDQPAHLKRVNAIRKVLKVA